jgi:hypothetical protein
MIEKLIDKYDDFKHIYCFKSSIMQTYCRQICYMANVESAMFKLYGHFQK